MSIVQTFINTVTVSVLQPPSPGTPVDASFAVEPDPRPCNPFGPSSTGSNPTNSFTISISTVDPLGSVAPNLVGAQLIFVFVPSPSSPIPFTVTNIQPNAVNSQPLYRGDRVLLLPQTQAAAVIMTVPAHLSARKTKVDYTVTIVCGGQIFYIDPDINVEVKD